MIYEKAQVYRAYGLRIRSDLPLPELDSGTGTADVVVRLGPVDRPPPDAEIREGCWRATAEEIYLFWQGAGAFRIRTGNEIVADPAPGLDPDSLRLTLLGPAIGALLHQRGFLVLHASAVVVEGGIVAFLGESGAGKSTTAAALHAQGYRLFVDDVLAVDVGHTEGPTAFPGFPRLKLWPDSAIALGHDPETLPPLRPGATKRDRRIGSGFGTSALPLRRIYVLDWGVAHGIVPLRHQQAFMLLSQHCYSGEVLRFSGLRANFFQTAELVNRVPIRQLRRERSLKSLDAVARLIERDLQQDDSSQEVDSFHR